MMRSWKTPRLRVLPKSNCIPPPVTRRRIFIELRLSGNDPSGWDFRGQNLGGASFQNANLTNADLTGAVVAEAIFADTTSRGLTKEQLYSTASYQSKDLQGISLFQNDLTGWDFKGQNLTSAFLWATLTNVDFTDAVVTSAFFGNSISKEQSYSTHNYKSKDLRKVTLGGIDVYFHLIANRDGWDFNGHDLSGAYLRASSMRGADLRWANLTDVTMFNVDLAGTDARGAVGLDLSRAFTRNLIMPDGTMTSLELVASERMLIRDDDGALPLLFSIGLPHERRFM